MNVLYLCYRSAVLFPRVAIHFLLVWGCYSAFLYYPQLGHPIVGFCLAFIITIASILSSYAYFVVWFHGPGSPLQFPDLCVGDREQRGGTLTESLPLVMQNTAEAKFDGGPRFCSKCNCYKPDRTHHCRHCNRCVLRMDHHCPWFASCVGFENHRYFIQFLFYALLMCFFAFTMAAAITIQFFKYQLYEEYYIGVNFVFFLVLSMVFTLIIIFFGGYTAYQVCINCTTLESLEPVAYRTKLPTSQWRFRRPPDYETLGNIYNIGLRNNVIQLMGRNWIEWLFPVPGHLPGNGTSFPVNMALRRRAEERAEVEIDMHRRRKLFFQNNEQH